MQLHGIASLPVAIRVSIDAIVRIGGAIPLAVQLLSVRIEEHALTAGATFLVGALEDLAALEIVCTRAAVLPIQPLADIPIAIRVYIDAVALLLTHVPIARVLVAAVRGASE